MLLVLVVVVVLLVVVVAVFGLVRRSAQDVIPRAPGSAAAAPRGSEAESRKSAKFHVKSEPSRAS